MTPSSNQVSQRQTAVQTALKLLQPLYSGLPEGLAISRGAAGGAR